MPTRFVTLMNPRPRRAIRRVRRFRMRRNRMGRFTRRSSSRRRRVHANPAPRVIYRTRTRTRFRTRRVVHHNPSTSAAVRRKISLAVKRANARRRSPVRRITSVVTRRFRRRSGGGRFGGGSLLGSFRSALSKGMITKAGGAVLGTLGTGYILNRFGSKLPLANNPYGRTIYTLGIPVAAAYFLRKKSPNLAEGLVIGGLVMTINTLMQGFRAQSAAVPAPAPAAGAVGSYSVAGELGQGTFGYYPQSMSDGRALGGSNVAFPGSAW